MDLPCSAIQSKKNICPTKFYRRYIFLTVYNSVGILNKPATFFHSGGVGCYWDIATFICIRLKCKVKVPNHISQGYLQNGPLNSLSQRCCSMIQQLTNHILSCAPDIAAVRLIEGWQAGLSNLQDSLSHEIYKCAAMLIFVLEFMGQCIPRNM